MKFFSGEPLSGVCNEIIECFRISSLSGPTFLHCWRERLELLNPRLVPRPPKTKLIIVRQCIDFGEQDFQSITMME
jgi:hypothetical protein